MSFMKSLAQVMFLVVGGLAFAQPPTIDLGPATPYNGFFFENFTSNGSDTQGRLAIGHTGSLKHYSVGDQLDPTTTGDVLVVGGNLAFPTGRVYFGNIVVGGQANAVGNAVINGLAPGATLQAGVAVPVDFSGAASQLTTLSQELAQLPANTTYQVQWGGLYLHGDGSSELQVFNLSGDEVLDAHTFEVDGIPVDAWVLFNIDGVQTGLTNMSLTSLQAHRSRVLFNFHSANNLKLRGIGVEGSVLAPFAHVANPQGVLHGQIVAKSWNGKMQLNHISFEPFDPKPVNDPPQFTSTPGTTATVSETYTYDAEASDPNGDALTFAVSAGPAGFGIDAVTGVTTWTPLPSQVGVHPVILTVADPDGLSDLQSFQITVESAPNQPPQFTSTPVTEATATQAYSYQATASDPENQLLTFSVVNGPPGLSIDAGTGLVSWVPLETQLGNHSVILEVADSDGRTDTQTFSISVAEPPNREPGFTSTPITSATATLAYSYQATAEDPDGDVLTFNVVSGPLGLSIDAATGLVSWVPNENQVGDHPLTLQISDPEGLTDTQTYAITVAEPPNRPPTFTSTPITAATATQVYSYQATATDPDGDVLAFSLVTGPSGLAMDANTGLVTWTPEESQVGDHPVTLNVSDPDGLSDTQTFTITVSEPPNRPPTFTSTPITTATATQTFTYQTTATDPDGDVLTYTFISGPSGLGIDSISGLVSWTPDESQVGDHPVTLQVADPEGLSDTQSFTITVSEPPNRAPSFTSTPPTTATATQVYSYQATATDPDNDLLFYTLGSGPSGLSIDANTGLVTWTPEESQVGDHPVTLQVVDPDGLSDTQTFTISVGEPPNRPPSFTSNPVLSATVQQLYSYIATAEDPDADVLTFGVITGPQGFFINPTTGAVSWTPADDQYGMHNVTLEVSDPEGLTDLQTFTIDVTLPANRSPQITSQPTNPHLLRPTTGQGDSLNLEPWQTFLFTNTGGPDGDPEWTFNEDFTDTIQIRNARASVLLSDSDFPYGQVKGTMRVGSTFDDDYIGIVFGWQDPRNFYLFDWKAGTQSGTSGPALQGMNLKLYQSDPQTPGFPLPWATEPVAGEGFNLYHNNIPWQRNRDYDFELEFQPGEISITVRQGTTVLDSFTVYDDSLTAGRFGFYNYSQENVTYNGFTSETAASHGYVYQATATDPDGDALQWTLLEGPDDLTLHATSGVLSWNTTRQDVGNVTIRIRVEDGKGGADEQTFELRVADEIPSITSQAPPSAVCGQLYIYDVSAVDPNPLSVFSFDLIVSPTGMTIEVTTGRMSWTPDATQKGVHTIHVRLSDQDGNTDEQIFDIYVVPPGNQPPVITSLPQIDAFVGAAYHYPIEAFDPEGGALFFNLAEAPTNLLLDPLTGFVSWTPTAQQLGERRVRLNVWDTANQFTEHVFTLLVQANEAPVFTSTPTTTVSEGNAYTYLVSASDGDGDVVTLRLLEGPEGMVFDAMTSTISWTPTGTQAGPHTVRLEARDSRQASSLQEFTLTVSEAIDGNPIITSTPTLEAATGQPYFYQIEAFDPEGLALDYQLINNPSGMTLSASGLVTWTPSGSQVGVQQVTVEVEDPAGNAASQTFLVAVSQTVNTPPNITSTPVSNATATLTYNYQVLADDADGDALTFALNAGPTGLSIDSNSGLVTWTPTEAQVGDHPVDLRVDDGMGGQDSQSFVVTVAPFVVTENAAPVFTSDPPTRVLSIGDGFTYTATATDADADPITFSLERGPAGLTIDSLSGLVQWANGVLGSHLVIIQAADNRGGMTRQSFSVNVQANGNSAPTITSTPLLTAEVDLEFEYEVKATDPDGFPFFFSLEQAPSGATIAPNSGVLRWTPSASQMGSQNFEIRVADPLDAADTQSFIVTVNPAGDHEPPFVAVNVLTFPADPNQDVTIQVVAGDTNGLASVALTIDGAPIVLDAQNEFIFNSPTPGAFIAEATAVDIAGNQATSQSNIYIRDLADTDNPFVEITSPSADSVLTAPTTITGTVQDASLAAWKLEVGLKGEDCFTTIATGKTAVTDAALGTLDPTLLPNGLYELRLSGTDTSRSGADRYRVCGH